MALSIGPRMKVGSSPRLKINYSGCLIEITGKECRRDDKSNRSTNQKSKVDYQYLWEV
jgi:hypothetical protein